MKKNGLAIIILLFLNGGVFAQEIKFKDVKTANDVIENFIIANGGKENLGKITSIRISGTLNAKGKDFKITAFTSSDFFYVNIDDSLIGSTVAVDRINKRGWQTVMGKIHNFSAEELNKYEDMMDRSLWRHLLDREKFGLNYEFRGIEMVNDNYTYVIDFIRDSSVLYTVYFDTSNYNRIKQIKDGKVSFFEDFRLVGDSGIMMAFKMTEQFPIAVDKYEFNTEFDKSLLNKPELKK